MAAGRQAECRGVLPAKSTAPVPAVLTNPAQTHAHRAARIYTEGEETRIGAGEAADRWCRVGGWDR